METKRLFVAVELPEELRKNIHEFAKQIEQDGIKLVEEHNLHVTMKFIGDVPEDKVEEKVDEKVDEVKDKIEDKGKDLLKKLWGN